MRAIVLGLAVMTAGCATADMSPVNQPMLAPRAETVSDLGVDGDVIALAFSGGGARAASFSYGVLLELRDRRDAGGTRLIDRVALVTAVSGGAITAAWLGQHGADGLDGFRAAALDKDWTRKIHSSLAWPGNWGPLLGGGMNDRGKLAGWLDREVFAGATMADIRARPRVVINATDLYTGAPFAFAPAYFEAICSDLSRVKVSDAVAASMAVPLAFRPTVVETYPKSCGPMPAWVEKAKADRSAPVGLRQTALAFEAYRDPAKMKYLHLVDGGVADNFGLSSLTTIRQASGAPYGPFSARDAVKVRRVTFLVVNAETTARADWPMTAKGPGGIAVMDAALDVSIDASKRNAYDAFGGMLREWERALVDYRCGLSVDEAKALGAGPGWDCKDVGFRLDMMSFADLPPKEYEELGALATEVSLPREKVDALIAGGRAAVAGNALVREVGAE